MTARRITALLLPPAASSDSASSHSETSQSASAQSAGTEASLTTLLDALSIDAPRPMRVRPDQVHVLGPGDPIPSEQVQPEQVPPAPSESAEPPEDAAADESDRPAQEDWFWLLPSDCLPDPDCLAHQLTAAEADDSACVIGAAQVRRCVGHPDRLISAGLTVSRGGALITGAEDGEIDQGQSDVRGDVLAVPATAMLVRADVAREQGILSAFTGEGRREGLSSPWAEIVSCHRVWRSGHRVILAPGARVALTDGAAENGAGGASGGASDGASGPGKPGAHAPAVRRRAWRRDQLLTSVALSSSIGGVLRLLLWPLLLLARMLGAVVTHRPRALLDEPLATAAALRRAPAVLARSARIRGRVPRRRLLGLLVPRSVAARRALDRVGTALWADDELTRRRRRSTWGIAGTRHGHSDAQYGRHGVWTLLLALTAAAVSLVALRPLLAPGALTARALVPLPEQWRATAQAAWASWVEQDAGHGAQADPLVRVLGSLGPVGGGAGLLEVILVGGLGLSAVSAWWAAGMLSRAVGVRLLLAALWALAPPALSALDEGRWPMLLVHILLPLVALTIARAVGSLAQRGGGSVAAAAVGGLGLLVIGAVQGVLVLLIAVILALVAWRSPGRRWRLVWFLAPSLVLWAPYAVALVQDPALLLSASAQPGSTPSSVSLLTLWPAPAPAPHWSGVTPWLGPAAAAWLPLLLLAPIALAALVAPFLPGAAGTLGRMAAVILAVALALAACCRAVPVGLAGTRVLHAPTHAVLSMAVLALLVGAGCTADTLARRDPGMGRARRGLTAGAGLLAAGTTIVAVVGWMLVLPGSLQLTRSASSPIPAAAADQGSSPARLRTLVLTAPARADADVTARLVTGGGDSVVSRSAPVDRQAVRAAIGGHGDADAASRALLSSAASVVGGSETGRGALADLAVGYVVVPGDPGSHAALVAALDRSPLLAKVTQNSGGALWRVVSTQPRAGIRTAATASGPTPAVLVPSQQITAAGEVHPATAPRVLTVSERGSDRWRAEIDGTALTRVPAGSGTQGFVIPAGAHGTVRLDHGQPAARLAAQIALALVVALSLLAAIPWRTSTPGSTREETR